MIPALEGSTHINYALTAQFAAGYFADSGPEPPPPPGSVAIGQVGSDENPYWAAARDRNPRTVRFAHYLAAYDPLRAVPNVGLFVRQAEAFARFAGGGDPAPDATADPGRSIARGRCLSVIAYGQLVAESCVAAGVAAGLVSVVFHGLVEDLAAEALALAALFPPGAPQRAQLADVVCVPETAGADIATVSDWIAARYGGQR
jgi:hypothetical protein